MNTLFPNGDWELESPAAHGLDASLLDNAASEVAQVTERYGLLVVKDGVIVFETYYRGDAGSRWPIFSLTKGFGAALTGIAQTRGWLDVKDQVSDWLPYHTPDIVEGATIEHLLSMTAGHAPLGSTYAYTSGPILNTLPNILWEAAGMPPRDLYAEHLAGPLELEMAWPSTAKGWMQIGNRGPMPVIEATHREIAKLGWLWLNEGRWKDEVLIDPAFIRASLVPPFPQANNAYGYLWWLNADSGTWRTARGDLGEGRWVPDAPTDLYMGIGARGKLLYVLPSANTVVVSLGETERNSLHAVWAGIRRFLT